ncbi:dihydropteroate synthase [Nesterenkonia sphaerica]|uniref:Dihydropteroate synthase n=1 Tax=Nesterenkonia sphaerica TaxID=1804988 RepID=A0A5R9A3X6_9MICC|nr:dihydropteroate synthase [Nesterenkonia sphaerica]TLP72755.1 dihydropteroate synthase [Nesterenkonia sphaerica]
MTRIMGILNVTPDSFSDGGRLLSGAGSVEVSAAVGEAERLLAAGADIIDIGGESTRPGADPVPPAQEQQRILPVVEALLDLPATVSVDTRHPETAAAALEVAGARAPQMVINDVSGLLTAPAMPRAVSDYGCGVVITHNRGHAQNMQSRAVYHDVVGEVMTELETVRQQYLDAGVAPEQIVLDPGIGFAKTHQQNWELLRHLGQFTALGHRVLLGVSRKGFLGELLTDAHGVPRPAAGREAATAALSVHAAATGCWAVRVHDPRPTADAFAVFAALGH